MSETELAPEPGHISVGRLYGTGAAAFRASSPAANPEEPEQPRLTGDELFDARTACASVSQSVLDDSQAAEYRLQQPWPHVRPGVTASIVEILEDVQRTEDSAQSKKRRREAYARTKWYQQRLQFLEGSFKDAGHASDTSSDDEPLDKRARSDMQSDSPFWTCVNCSSQQHGDTAGDLQVCNFKNHFTRYNCAACGAARWDGPGGQLEACTAAAFQTADLDNTNSRQLLARVDSCTQSKQAAGLRLPKNCIRAEISKHASKVQLHKLHAAASWPMKCEQQLVAHPSMTDQDLLPLPENERGTPGTAIAAQLRMPSSLHRPLPSKQTDAFVVLQNAILDLNSDIRHGLQPCRQAACQDEGLINGSQPAEQAQNDDDPDAAAGLDNTPDNGIAASGQQTSLSQHEIQASASEEVAPAQTADAAEFAKGFLRFLMMEAVDQPQLS